MRKVALLALVVAVGQWVLPEDARAEINLSYEVVVLDEPFDWPQTSSHRLPYFPASLSWEVYTDGSAQPPAITGQPASVTVTEGQTATFSVAATGSAPLVTLVADNASPQVGESFRVTVELSGADPFANWAAYLTFDNTVVELTAQANGTFSTFVADARSLADINASGEVRAGGFALADNAGGDGTLGVFTFKALAAGVTEITTENKSVANAFGNVLMPTAGGEVLPGIDGPLGITVTDDGGGGGDDDAADDDDDDDGGGCSLSGAGDAGVAGWLLPWAMALALRMLGGLGRKRRA
jgi:hypothetical protein